MHFKKLLKEILNLEIFDTFPPVLLDIGASGAQRELWKKISKYSICIAFDADNREISYIEKTTSNYRKLFVFNCIVSDKNTPQIDFYLTESPYCSSTLEPNLNELKNWAYSEKFNITEKVKIKSQSLMDSLKEVNINYIDWFKSDSQGTDLRLFNSLHSDISKKVIAAEFEPGFINSYKGEDRLSDLIKEFEKKDFWLSNMTVKGSQRLTKNQLDKYFKSNLIKKLAQFSHKTSPGWAELIYLNDFNKNDFSVREYLLGWIFATILKQHGFAILLIEKLIAQKIDDEKFNMLLKKMHSYSLNKIKKNILELKFFPFIIIKIKQLAGIQ